MWPELTLLDQVVVKAFSCLVFLQEDPSGDIHTPSILEACDGGSLSIFCGP